MNLEASHLKVLIGEIKLKATKGGTIHVNRSIQNGSPKRGRKKNKVE
jgi:hypothetical protein